MRPPLLMGVLNVTPDSFSDGGQLSDARAAVARGFQMAEEGADWIDVGGESTRPGAEPVSLEEELRRVAPVVEGLAGLNVSVDTRKPEVARAALRAGARMVNDVGGLRDPAMVKAVAEHGCEVVIMHMRGEPGTMQDDPRYGDVITEVRDYLWSRAERAQAQGVAPERIWIDPGIGFGKTLEHNLALLRHLNRIAEGGYPVLVGASRKGFLGKLTGGAAPEDRLEATLAAHLWATSHGAAMVRAHDVRAHARAMKVWSSLVIGSPRA